MTLEDSNEKAHQLSVVTLHILNSAAGVRCDLELSLRSCIRTQ